MAKILDRMYLLNGAIDNLAGATGLDRSTWYFLLYGITILTDRPDLRCTWLDLHLLMASNKRAWNKGRLLRTLNSLEKLGYITQANGRITLLTAGRNCLADIERELMTLHVRYRKRDDGKRPGKL